MTMNNRGFVSVKRRLSLLNISVFLLLILTVPMYLVCCSKENRDVSSEGHKSLQIQKFSGTLPVRIVPESPTVADDLQAAFVRSSGVTYTWEKNGVVLDGVTGYKLPRNQFSKHDTVTVSVRKGSEKGSATVIIGNALPTVASVTLQPVDIHRGVDISAVPVAVDPDGDTVKFDCKWFLNGTAMKDNSLVLSGNTFRKGDQISFEVIPLDNEGAGPLYKTKSITIPNAQPYFTSVPPANFEGVLYTYQVKAEDPDGDHLTYSLATAPIGMVINATTGALSWHVAPGGEGTIHIEIEVCDAEGARATQKFSLNLM